MKPYFYVLRIGSEDAPTMRHKTLGEAHKEAERLASKHPGEQFQILECRGISVAQKAKTTWLDGVSF